MASRVVLCVRAVSAADFWNTESPNPDPKKGHMALKMVLETKGGANSVTIKASFDGFGPDNKLRMTETRTITFFTDPELRIIDYVIANEPAPGQKQRSKIPRKAPSACAWPQILPRTTPGS